MQLSHRMQSVADLVTPGECLADIGTDHGYIPIEMVRTGRTKRAIAMDDKEGPPKACCGKYPPGRLRRKD